MLMIITLLFSISFMAEGCNLYDRPAEEQWYLNYDSEQEVNTYWLDMWELYSKIDNSHKGVVKVAVIDTGVDARNPEIKDSIIADRDNSDDRIGHGTAIAGIICASQYHGKVVGVSDSRRTRIVPIKVTMKEGEDEPYCTVGQLIEAIKHAEEKGCAICNISLNTDNDDPELEKTISESGMLFVFSAGNGTYKGRNIDSYPSYPASYNYDNLITVTNVKANGRIHSTANYGNCVDIAAPGTEIYNIGLENEYITSTGTSYAAPIVTGLAAMLYICDKDMTPAHCKKIILDTALEERRIRGKACHNRLVQLDVAIAVVAKDKEK